MGDVGDYWREHKEFKKRLRSHWHECPSCAVAFGTGTLVAPGRKCRNCDWKAPGVPGEDLEKARRATEAFEIEAEARVEKQARKLAERTCKFCKKVFGTPHGRAEHERQKHKARKDIPNG